VVVKAGIKKNIASGEPALKNNPIISNNYTISKTFLVRLSAFI
jgi:hypothetical protein